MNRKIAALIAAASVCATGFAASADVVTGTITADNHYALFTSTGGVFTYHGGNEIGPGGEPGTYNWSEAESYEFDAGDFLYIAAWSDDSVAQGVLAQFSTPALGTILSGDSRWEVYGTNVNRGDGDPHPTTLDMAGHVAFADTNVLWEPTFVGGANGVEPWGTIAGITDEAHWMWKSIDGDEDPLHGGSGAAEMLIFRTPVPAPGSIALLGLGGLAAVRRRR